jgi:N-acetylglucosamine kinase-like BadF-type ATPase
MTARPVLVADIGKSTTRLAAWIAGEGDGAGDVAGRPVTASGIAGLAAPGGATQAMNRLEECLDLLGATRPDDPGDDAGVAVGVAGALAAPAAAAELARELASRWRMPACVTSDVVTAHLGALAGAPGTILVAGTGAVAWSLSPDGETRLADGLGPDRGDRGSGYWIGRAGMAAALGDDDTTPPTTLTDRWRTHAAALAPASAPDAPLTVAGIAAFARTVLEAADDGDRVADGIIARAVDELVATARSASSDGDPVACLGGLTQHASFALRLHTALRAAGRRPQSPLGSALAGAALAATADGLPHERLLHRDL